MLLLVGGTYIIFGHIFIPVWINGRSMEPNYHDGDFTFCFGMAYLFREPEWDDVVAIRFAGKHVMLLKRIVALEGQVVEFREGVLYVDGEPANEDYVKYRGRWNLPPRVVEAGNIYIVGDNRSMHITQHKFGQTSKSRVIGSVLF